MSSVTIGTANGGTEGTTDGEVVAPVSYTVRPPSSELRAINVVSRSRQVSVWFREVPPIRAEVQPGHPSV